MCSRAIVPHTTNSILDLDLTNDSGAIGLDLLEKLSLGGNNLLQSLLEVGL